MEGLPPQPRRAPPGAAGKRTLGPTYLDHRPWMRKARPGSCRHTACCHGDRHVYQAGCPGNADAGGVSWHRPRVCTGRGRGWVPTSAGLEPWKSGNGPGRRPGQPYHLRDGPPRATPVPDPGLGSLARARPVVPSPQGSESLGMPSRKSPVPHRLSSAPAPALGQLLLWLEILSYSVPGTVPSGGQATPPGPLLVLAPPGEARRGEARAIPLASRLLGLAQGPDFHAPSPSICSWGGQLGRRPRPGLLHGS